MVRYSLGDDYEFDDVSAGASLKYNQGLEIEFLGEMVRESKGSVVYQIGMGGSVVSRPTIHGNRVYFGACDRNVYAVDLETGMEMWRFSTGGPVTAAVAVDEGRVYVGSYDGNLYALDMEGNLIWKFHAGDKIGSAPAVNRGNIYFGCKDGNLYALDRCGNLVWKFHTNGPLGSPVVIYKDRIYVGSFDYNIYAVGLDGNLAWKFAANDHVGGPCAYRDNIYFGSFDRCVYAVDISGNLLWRFETNDAIPVGTNINANDDILYFGSRDNNLYAVRNGRLIWKFKTGNMIFHRPIIEGDRLYFCSGDGNLYALNASTGEELWRFSAGGPVISLEKSGDVICFGCYDCNVYAINTEGELLWKFHTSLDFPASVEFTPQVEHVIQIFVPEQRDRRISGKETGESKLGFYGDFKGSYIQDEMRDYIGLPMREGDPGMMYKRVKRVYRR